MTCTDITIERDMGQITHPQHRDFIERYGTKTFFETGTNYGNGVRRAMVYAFERIHTVEIWKPCYKKTKSFIKDKRCRFHLGDSPMVMNEVLPDLAGTGPILFWLDAHCPGADSIVPPKDGKFTNDQQHPLIRELLMISELRSSDLDVIIIDDRNYVLEIVPDLEKLIREIFPGRIVRHYQQFDEGYIHILPYL